MKNDSKKIKESLRPVLFWDMDYNELDFDQHAAFIIIRVMEHGTKEEVRAIWNYFGAETIKKHLLSARALSPKTISYFANLFKVNRSQFRCNTNQERVKTWP
jgi:hypothetical protein